MIVNNTFDGGGISCGGSGIYEKLFEANIFNNSSALPTTAGCTYRYNLITPTMSVTGTGNFTGAPMFRAPTTGDFHLTAGSAAIDADLDPTIPNGHDRDGVSRPQGTHSDVGAFEYVP